MNVEVFIPKEFKPLHDPKPSTWLVLLMGGRGGKKTYTAALAISYGATIQQRRFQILRDEKAHIKESILNDTLLRYDAANKEGAFDGMFQRLDTGIKNLYTNEMAVFTKGFRGSSNAQVANLKSVSNVDTGVIEEGQDIRSEDKFNTYADSLRKEGSTIWFILNTPDINHFIIKRYFNLRPVTTKEEPNFTESELDGYFICEPKDIEGVEYVLTSFEDNEYLPQKIVDRYRAYGIKGSTSYNPHYYFTAIKGYASTGLKGQILKNYKIISQEEFNSIDATEVIGLDFGTSSPAGMVLVKMVKNNLYAHELNYEGMDNRQIAFKLSELEVGNTLIIADSAEPESIKELSRGFGDSMTDEEKLKYPQAVKGFNIRGAVKGPGSIESGLKKLLSLKIHITSTSVNTVKEFQSYIYATDKNNMPTDKPIDANNHIIDPLRYVSVLRGRLF